MIVNFENYKLTYEELNERLTLVSVEPKFENKDFAEFSVFMKGLYEDKNSELFKFADAIKIKPVKKTLLESINATYQRNIDSILSQYPSAEVTGWTTKVFQAERWLAASDSDKQALLSELPMLVSEANSQDFAVITDLATRIKRKSDAYQLFHGTQTGIRYDLTDRLELVKTSEELEAFKIYMESKGY